MVSGEVRDLMMIMKVIEHVYEKVMNGGSEGGSGAGTPTGDRNQSDRETAESASMAEDRVELLCNDTILDPNMDLRYHLKPVFPGVNLCIFQDRQTLHMEIQFRLGITLQTPQIDQTANSQNKTRR